MNGLFSLIPLIVFIPFIGVLVNLFFGRRLMPSRDSIAPGVIASLMSGGAFLIALLMWIALLANPGGAEVSLGTWMNIPVGALTFSIPWTFKVDTLSSVMMLVITGIGTLIHIYAIGYMHGDIDEQAAKRGFSDEEAADFKRRRFPRFFTYLNLFLGSMLILVTGNNYLMLFVGWELVGLCSYLLIGFWFDDPVSGISNSSAGRKAFIVNRVGDFGMVIALALLFWTFGSLQFDEVFARAECMKTGTQAECLTAAPTHAEGGAEVAEEGHAEGAVLTYNTPISFGTTTLPLGVVVMAATLLMLLGATGKSAQIPLFVWLPDAMAGPTPVSALIHAATMVTAGIYMITRSNVLFAMAPVTGFWVSLVGALTAFVAATIAVGQYDIKKVLAYSTISQLGFMIAAVGLGGYTAGIFHLATHAFFKALLFLSAGSVIHGMEHGHHATTHHGHDEHHDEHHDDHAFDPQDMRNMGGLRHRMPITTWVYIIGSLALAGIVPLAGFWSKDEILLDASRENFLVYALLSVAAFFTAFYMGRQVLMVFFGGPRTEAAGHAHESPPVMTTPLIVLAVLAVIGGAMNLPFGNLNFLAQWLHHSVVNVHVESAFSIVVAGLSTMLALAAIGLSYLLYGQKPLADHQADPLTKSGPVFSFLNHKWYWDEVYAWLIVRPFTRISRWLADVVDWRFWHDYVHDTVIAKGLYTNWSQILSTGDKRFVDGAFDGIGKLVRGSAGELRRTQTGYVRNYALAVALGVVIILAALLAFLVQAR